MNYKSLNTLAIEVLKGVRESKDYTSLNNVAKKVLTRVTESRDELEKDHRDQIAVGSYKTQHFEMCPVAQKLYGQDLPRNVDVASAEKSVIEHDKLFGIEKGVIAKERATEQDIRDAELSAQKIKELAKKMNLEKEHDYIDMHVKKIKQYEELVPRFDVPKERIEMEKMKRFASKPYDRTQEPPDRDIDNDTFATSRATKMQRKLKIIDND